VLDGIPIALLNGLGGMALWTLIGYLMLTDRLVWHTRLNKEIARGDKWEGIALRALGVAEKMTVHAEVANEVLTAIPVPGPQTPDTQLSSGGAGP
jgi:hypothetical protein